MERNRGENYLAACRAILESLVIGSFWAFEVWAGDLWVRMVDQRPSSAMESFLKTEGKNQEKSIPISVALKYDMKNQMGRMLREQEKVQFDSLAGIKREYTKTFGPSAAGPFERELLSALELARNVLAHRGGNVDARFEK